MKNTFYFLFLLLVFTFWISDFNSADAALIIQAPKYIGLTNGLVGYWSFDGKDMAVNTAYDRSGNANNGTLTNGPVRAIGKIGQALEFDSTNDIVNAQSNTVLDNLAVKTICAWIKPSAFNFRDIMSKMVTTGTGWVFRLAQNCPSGDRLCYYHKFDTSAGYWSTTGITNNAWSHACVAFDSSSSANDPTFFINGESKTVTESITPNGGSSDDSTANLIIGNLRTDLDDPSFGGLIDDVRIYNRALSGDEIKRLYKIGATLKINTSINNDSLTKGLVGYWSFNGADIAGTTAYDRSGQAKNGSALGQDISAQGLVGWWKLDGASSGSIANGTTVGLEDSSGQGNNGTASNVNTTGMAWTTGKIGLGATSFDGVDDYVALGNAPSPLRVTSNLTFSAWVKIPSDVGEVYVAIIGRNADVSLMTHWSDHKLRVFAKPSGGVGAEALHSTGTSLNTNTWWHVAITYNLLVWTAYVNGVQDGTGTGVTGILSDVDGYDTDIGFYGNGSAYGLGLIDDVRIYNRALSAAEVAQLYNYGLPKFTPAIGRLGQGIDSTKSYVNPGNVSSSVNSFSFWMKTASSSPTVNLLDLNASQGIKIVAGTVTASGLTSPSIFVDGASGSTVNAGWHHIAVTTGTAINASAVNLGLNATTTAPLDGVLDDVRFYNRVINNDEIKRLYRIGATLKINTSINNDSLQKGLVGWWSFDGKDMAGTTAYDRSGNANNGTLTNGPTRAIGKIGQGLKFGANDTDDKVSITSNFDGTGAVSVSAWMYPRGGGGGGFGRIITNEQLFVAVRGSDSSLLVSRDSGANACASLASVWAVNNWYHVIMISPASGATAQWYINGLDVTNEAGCGTPVSATSWNIGNNAESSRSFNGSIDDVRIYNRALTADEIKRLYNLGR